MKILFCASEAYPFVKSGGLADVAFALPKALVKKESVTLLLPWYHFMKLPVTPIKLWDCELSFGGHDYPLSFWQCNFEGVEVILVKSTLLYESEKLYGLSDDDLRFTLFCRAIVTFAENEKFDILHLNDWHTALAALFAKEKQLSCRIVFTIHNLAFQGVFAYERLDILGIEKRYFHMEMLEFYGNINFMKAGIAFSDAVTTVSPTYAKEIQTPDFGCGLDGFLRKHHEKLSGIINGIDTEVFNPESDEMIACHMKRKISTFKRCNKKSLLGKKDEKPLFVFIGRMTEQKGIDLLVMIGEELAKLPVQFAFLGDGEEEISQKLESLVAKSKNLHYFKGYNEALAHQLYAAADFLVMPSRYEPCGLNQMIAMHYGTVPIVYKTGGLSDTVHEKGKKCGRGIVFIYHDKKHLLKAIRKALQIYKQPQKMEKINQFNMACDFSFEKSAEKYLSLYRQVEKE